MDEIGERHAYEDRISAVRSARRPEPQESAHDCQAGAGTVTGLDSPTAATSPHFAVRAAPATVLTLRLPLCAMLHAAWSRLPSQAEWAAAPRFNLPRRRFFAGSAERCEPAVFERDDAVEAAGEVEVVGGDQRREPAARGRSRSASSITPSRGGVIEIAGRLVGQQDLRVVGQRADDRDALLLAAGEPRRAMVERAAPSPTRSSSCRGLARGPRRRGDAGDHLRQHDVLQRRELRQQVVELVDEAERAAPQQRAVLVGQAAAIAAARSAPRRRRAAPAARRHAAASICRRPRGRPARRSRRAAAPDRRRSAPPARRRPGGTPCARRAVRAPARQVVSRASDARDSEPFVPRARRAVRRPRHS